MVGLNEYPYLYLVKKYLGNRIRTNVIKEELPVICPFHKEGKELHPSLYINIKNGVAFCHTCHKGWSLYDLLRDLGIPENILKAEFSPISWYKKSETLMQGHNVPADDKDKLFNALFAYPQNLINSKIFSKEECDLFEIRIDSNDLRVVFPIRDISGKLGTVIGRSLDGRSPRYRVYSDLFPDKPTDHLWNLHNFYRQAVTLGIPYLVVVEGIKKGIYLHRNGFPFVVALNGSYLSLRQQSLLTRLKCEVIIAFTDDDAPGKACASLLIDKLAGRKVRRPRFPQGITQPDEIDSVTLKEVLYEVLD